MSKNETIAAWRMVAKLDLSSLHARQGFLLILWGNFKFSLLLLLNMTLQLLYVKVELFFQQPLFYVISIKLEGWSSIFLVFYEPKYTQIDLTRQLTSTNLLPVWWRLFFVYIYNAAWVPKFRTIQWIMLFNE